MKIVIAPDSWKESLSALEVASAIEQGFRQIYPDAEYVKLPVADGGEGTVEAMGRWASRLRHFTGCPAIASAPLSKWRQPAAWRASRRRSVTRC